MEIDIYDTYALAPDGKRLHFDVLLPAGSEQSPGLYAAQWLKRIGIAEAGIRLEQCRFCHSESAQPEIAERISSEGYFIFQMEGCPSPIF